MGFDHYQIECPNFLRRQNKGYTTTLSNEESDSSNEPEVDVYGLFGCITKKFLNHVKKVSQMF